MKKKQTPGTPNNACAEIIPGLWIGSLAALKVIDSEIRVQRRWRVISLLGSEKLINLSRVLIASSTTLIGCRHEVWRLSDSSQGVFLSDRLSSILELIDESLPSSMAGDDGSANRACLIHCAQGISRSAAVCTAWLISRKKMSLEDALAQVQSVRREVSPNLGFLASLRALEQCSGNVADAMHRMNAKK